MTTTTSTGSCSAACWRSARSHRGARRQVSSSAHHTVCNVTVDNCFKSARQQFSLHGRGVGTAVQLKDCYFEFVHHECLDQIRIQLASEHHICLCSCCSGPASADGQRGGSPGQQLPPATKLDDHACVSCRLQLHHPKCMSHHNAGFFFCRDGTNCCHPQLLIVQLAYTNQHFQRILCFVHTWLLCTDVWTMCVHDCSK